MGQLERVSINASPQAMNGICTEHRVWASISVSGWVLKLGNSPRERIGGYLPTVKQF